MFFLLFILIIGLLTAGYFAAVKILALMTQYLTQVFSIAVVSLAPHDIILTIFKIDFILVSIVLLPFLLIAGMLYIAPALYEQERRFFKYIPAIFLLSVLGIFFGWIISIKVFIPYLQSFSGLVSIPNNWSIVNVISFILTICTIFLAIFQLPVIVTALVGLGFLKLEQITKIRKIVILIAVFFGAIVTPPDAASQLIVALPFYLLFETTVQFLRLNHKLFRKK